MFGKNIWVTIETGTYRWCSFQLLPKFEINESRNSQYEGEIFYIEIALFWFYINFTFGGR